MSDDDTASDNSVAHVAPVAQVSANPSWSDDIWVPQTSWTGPTIATLGTSVMWTHPGAGNPEGHGIWYSEGGFFDVSGHPFGYDFPIGNQASNDQAALAAFGSQLYMIHPGGVSGDTGLWITHESGGGNWSSDARLPFDSSEIPAAVAYFGKLYALVRAPGGWRLMVSSNPSDTRSWSQWGTLSINAHGRPSMAVFNQLVYIVFGDSNPTPGFQSERVSYVTFNGFTVSQPVGVPVDAGPSNAIQWCSYSRPSVATYAGRLQLVHSGCSSHDATSMWHLSFDGAAWSTDQQIWGHWAANGFSLAATPWTMFVAHDGQDGSGPLYYAYYQ